MKLIAIANRLYLSALILVFMIGSLAAYFVMKSIINHEFNEKLYAEQDQLIYELNNYSNLEKTYYLNIGDVIELEEVAFDANLSPVLHDTVMYDPYEKKELPFRQLKFSSEIKDKHYIITISKSLLPNQDLIEGVSEIMIGLMIVLVLVLGLLNRIIFSKLWSPFHQIIEHLRDFNITQPHSLELEKSNVDEFNKLGDVLEQMVNKSMKDYRTLKEYTENTSHEIQTPLAIIKNKAEVLLQEPLEEKHMRELSKIYEAAGRLARLKEGLSTLTKIDNHQFPSVERIDLNAYVHRRIDALQELLEIKNINVEWSQNDQTYLDINGDLLYLMINNLLNNAIKHNVQNGSISIAIANQSISIQNPGKPPQVPVDQLFERFKKSSSSAESTGLGLAIVKRIADHYGFHVSYTYQEPNHKISIQFNPKKNL